MALQGWPWDEAPEVAGLARTAREEWQARLRQITRTREPSPELARTWRRAWSALHLMLRSFAEREARGEDRMKLLRGMEALLDGLITLCDMLEAGEPPEMAAAAAIRAAAA